MNKISKYQIKQHFYASFSALIVLLLFSLMFLVNFTAFRNDAIEIKKNELDRVADVIEFKLNEALSFVNVIEVLIMESIDRYGDINFSQTEEMQKYVFNYAEYVDAVMIAPDGIIQYIYPLTGYESVLGHNLLVEGDSYEFVNRAIELKKCVAQGPVLKLENKWLVINRHPIFIQNRLWGLVSIAVDFEKFMDEVINITNIESSDHIIFVPKADGQNDYYWGNQTIFEDNHILETIHLPELDWEMATSTPSGWSGYGLYSLFYLLLGLLASLWTFMFVKKKLLKHESIKIEARTDSLTGCNNRLEFDKLLESKVLFENGCALFVTDLDNFKQVNDVLGHDAGDLVLKEIAAVFKSSLRDCDQVYRIGGDEFVVLLRNIRSRDEIKKIASRIIEKASKEIDFNKQRVMISISIGIAVCVENGITLAELYKKVDLNLYEAKSKGKNQYFMD